MTHHQREAPPYLGPLRPDYVPNPAAWQEMGPLPVQVTSARVKTKFQRQAAPSQSSRERFAGVTRRVTPAIERAVAEKPVAVAPAVSVMERPEPRAAEGTLGAKVRAAREGLKLDLAAMARRLKLNPKTLQNVERGRGPTARLTRIRIEADLRLLELRP